jgi:diguanylate cyclase (GGDEF)-like protein
MSDRTPPLRILFVEDQPDDIELENRELRKDGLDFEMRTAASEGELRAALEEFKPSVVLCDYSIPGFSGRQALEVVKAIAPETPFIFVSGTIGEETAVECLREGAIDYVLKDNPRRLGSAVRRALRETEERKGYEARIRRLAHYDALTDLPNRALLVDRVEQALAIARRARRGLTLLAVNIDVLRLVTEGFGQAAEDEAILELSARIAARVRMGDTVARTGRDEFMVLFSDIDQPEDVHAYARRVLDAIKAPHAVAGTELVITASAGAAIFPGDGDNVETLIGKAGAAAHEARSAGRDTFRFSSPDTMRNALDRILMETALTQAFERRTLEVHYQTQHDLASGKVCGLEALLRWQREDGTWVPPSAFIRMAEETGLIRAIGERVLEDACTDALPWIAASGNKMHLAVNVSVLQIREDGFVDRVARMLRSTGFPIECLELEMTESALMSG